MDVKGTDGEGGHLVHWNQDDREVRRSVVKAAINCKHSGSIKLFDWLRKYQLLKKYTVPESQVVSQLLFFLFASQLISQLISQSVSYFFCLSVIQLLCSFQSNSQSVSQSVRQLLFSVCQSVSQLLCFFSQIVSQSVSQLAGQSDSQLLCLCQSNIQSVILLVSQPASHSVIQLVNLLVSQLFIHSIIQSVLLRISKSSLSLYSENSLRRTPFGDWPC